MFEIMLAHGGMSEGINPALVLFGAIALMGAGLARVLRQERSAPDRSKSQPAEKEEAGAGRGKEAPTAR